MIVGDKNINDKPNINVIPEAPKDVELSDERGVSENISK
jgi:hypothetical protein